MTARVKVESTKSPCSVMGARISKIRIYEGIKKPYLCFVLLHKYVHREFTAHPRGLDLGNVR